MIQFSALHIFLFIGFLKLFHEHFVPEMALVCAVKERAIVIITLIVMDHSSVALIIVPVDQLEWIAVHIMVFLILSP